MTSKKPPISFGAWWIRNHTYEQRTTERMATSTSMTANGWFRLKTRRIEGLLNSLEKMSKNSIDSVWHGRNINFVDEMFYLWSFRAVYCSWFDAFFRNSSVFWAQLETHIVRPGAQICAKKQDAFALFQVEFWNDVTREQHKNNRTVHREWKRTRTKSAKSKFKRKQNVHEVLNTNWKKNLSLMHTQRYYCEIHFTVFFFRWTHTTIGLFLSSSWSLFSLLLLRSVLYSLHPINNLSILSLRNVLFVSNSNFNRKEFWRSVFSTLQQNRIKKPNEEWRIMRHCCGSSYLKNRWYY